MRPRWTGGPREIVLVRHGQSIGNQADERARACGAERLDLPRDADVELSPAGQEQADAVGRWLGGLEDGGRPTAAVSSPYRRAQQTAQRALAHTDLTLDLDERLRERDLGVLDGLTGAGIRALHPDEAARRARLGKFYYQPPSGESWADVALRVRSLLTDLRHGHDEERVLLITHQAVIMSFRYVLEDLDEEHLLGIDREVQIPNASLTRFVRADDVFELDVFADAAHVDAEDAPVTHEQPHQGASR